MRIVICDDNPNELENSKKAINEYFSKLNISCEVMTFEDPNTLLSLFFNLKEDFEIDAFFLDVIMQINGINVAKTIKEKRPDALVVFTTTSTEFALDAFSVKAFNYLMKPLNKTLLHSVLDDILLLKRDKLNNRISIKTADLNIINIEINSIKYIESINRRMIFYLNDGREITSLSLRGKFLDSVPFDYKSYNFLNCHSAFIVNMNYISEIQNTAFVLKDGTEVPIAIRYFKTCKKAYIDYLLGE